MAKKKDLPKTISPAKRKIINNFFLKIEECDKWFIVFDNEALKQSFHFVMLNARLRSALENNIFFRKSDSLGQAAIKLVKECMPLFELLVTTTDIWLARTKALKQAMRNMVVKLEKDESNLEKLVRKREEMLLEIQNLRPQMEAPFEKLSTLIDKLDKLMLTQVN